MKEKQYRITVEPLTTDSDSEKVPDILRFDVTSHDDILKIVERINDRKEFTKDSAAAFAVGLKLFSGVMRAYKDNPIFTDFYPHFREFMKTLKKGKSSS